MISATNIIVRQRFGRGGPTIALNAHGDVVPPGEGWTRDPYGAVVVDDPVHGPTMYGRGVAVSKSDFATYAYALLALKRLPPESHKLNGTVELHFTYDEEVGGEIGPRWLLAQGLSRPDYAICAGFSYAVTTAHSGCLHLEVTVKGRRVTRPCRNPELMHWSRPREFCRPFMLRERSWRRGSRQSTHYILHGQRGSHRRRNQYQRSAGSGHVSHRPANHPRRESCSGGSRVASAHRAGGRRASRHSCGDPGGSCWRLPLKPLPGAERLTQALQRHGQSFFGVPIGEHGVPLYTDARHYSEFGVPTVLYGAGPRTLAEANGHGADECLRLNDLRGGDRHCGVYVG